MDGEAPGAVGTPRELDAGPLTAASPRPSRPAAADAAPSPPAEADSSEGIAIIGPLGSARLAREWALVLQSMSIWHAVRTHEGIPCLVVRRADGGRAQRAIDSYVRENDGWPPRRTRDRALFPASPLVVLAFLALGAFFLATGPVAGGARWFARGASVAGLVTGGEPWRAVTALTLHADSVHVLGNVISGTIFASAVQRRLGPGGAALAVVLSGIAGNVANAFWHRAMGSGDHASIGASTAVFGAIGILASTQMWFDRQRTHRATSTGRWLAALAPLAGGLALLGALGAGARDELGAVSRTDLGAHGFGFLAGLVVGLLAALPARGALAGANNRWGGALQAGLAAVAFGIVVVAWRLALRG